MTREVLYKLECTGVCMKGFVIWKFVMEVLLF